MKRLTLILMLLLPLTLPAQPPAPDERVLWQLLHAGKLNMLKRAIDELRQRYPGWQPPTQLLEEMARLQGTQAVQTRDRRIAAAIDRRDWHTLIRLSQQLPDRFSCRYPHFLQALALAHSKVGHLSESLASYRRLLGCPKVKIDPVLQQALWQLPPQSFDRLLQQARGKLSADTWNLLRYQSRRRKLLALHEEGDMPALLNEAEALADTIVAHRDLDLIRTLGWAAYRHKDFQTAAFWFRKGLGLKSDEELAYGLALASRQLGDDRRLLELVNRFARDSVRIRQLAGDYFLAQAWEAYRQQDYQRARRLAQRALPWLKQTGDALYLMGWIEMKTGNPQAALKHFETLYRARPDDERYAEALAQAYLQSKWH